MAASETKLVVFNLPSDVRDSEVKDLFRKFGKIRDYHVRDTSGRVYAFVEYEDPRDAEDALERRNDYHFAGKRLRVEFSRPPRREQPSAAYRVKVTGLPRTASWQDLKDFVRGGGGDVRFTEVEGTTGIAGFSSMGDMEKTIRECDDTKFRARNGDTAYVRVKEDRGGRSESRGRSRSGDKKRSASRHSRPVSKSKKRSASRSRRR